jgi:hypothetical protein
LGGWRGGCVIFREVELFEFLKNKIPDLESGTATERFDAVSMNQRAIFELKCRRTHYDDLMIEQSKWAKMVEIGLLRGFRAFYVSSTPLGIYCWELDALKPPKWQMKALPNRTDFPGSQTTTRPVGFLHIDSAWDLLRHTENPFIA